MFRNEHIASRLQVNNSIMEYNISKYTCSLINIGMLEHIFVNEILALKEIKFGHISNIYRSKIQGTNCVTLTAFKGENV